MPRGKPNPKTIPMPTDWRDHFKASTLRTSFVLSLTRTMLEFLCAVADDVSWDRATFGESVITRPDNWIASSLALQKRGLVVRKSREQIEAELKKRFPKGYREPEGVQQSFWVLTPAGTCIVELLKMTGMFIEADEAIEKRCKRG